VEPGQNLGKPGRPFTVYVTVKGYFAAAPKAAEDGKAADSASEDDKEDQEELKD
jgi:hypothetical protein